MVGWESKVYVTTQLLWRKMKRLKRTILLFGITLVVAVSVVIIKIDSIVHAAVTDGGSYALMVPVDLEQTHVSLMGGGASLQGFNISNPPKFSSNHAIKFDELFVQLKMTSLLSEVVEVDEIIIQSPQITIEESNGEINLKVLMDNVKKRIAQSNLGNQNEEAENKQPTTRRYSIGRIEISNAKVSLASSLIKEVSSDFEINSLVIEDLNSEMTMAEVLQQILESIIAESGTAAGDVGKIMKKLLKDVGGEISDKAKNIVDEGLKEAEKEIEEAGNKLRDAFKR